MKLAKSLGCDAFVSKPFVPEELLALVVGLIQKHEKTKQEIK